MQTYKSKFQEAVPTPTPKKGEVYGDSVNMLIEESTKFRDQYGNLPIAVRLHGEIQRGGISASIKPVVVTSSGSTDGYLVF